MDIKFIGIESYLDRTNLMQQCIDYLLEDIDYLDNHDTFHFSIDWNTHANNTVIYMPFYQYVEEYDRHITFKYSTDLGYLA